MMNRARRRLFLLLLLALLLLLVGVVAAGLSAWDRLCGNYPISFYGTVVNANGVGIEGVTVEFQVLYSDRLALPVMYGRDEKIRKVTVISDQNGNFDLKDQTGYSISVRGFFQRGRELNWAFPPPDTRIPTSTFSYGNRRSRALIPDTPRRRLSYPLLTISSQNPPATRTSLR